MSLEHEESERRALRDAQEARELAEAEGAIAGWGTQFAELQEQYVQFKQQSAERQSKLEEELMAAELMAAAAAITGKLTDVREIH